MGESNIAGRQEITVFIHGGVEKARHGADKTPEGISFIGDFP